MGTDATGVMLRRQAAESRPANLGDPGRKVMNRTMVILDIFASRAHPEARSRWSWPSSNTGLRAWWACAPPCPDWAATSTPGDRAKEEAGGGPASPEIHERTIVWD